MLKKRNFIFLFLCIREIILARSCFIKPIDQFDERLEKTYIFYSTREKYCFNLNKE